MSQENVSEAIFGAFDGVVCVLGVILAASLSGHSEAIPVAGIGLAISESVSMAGAAILSGRNRLKVALMFVASFISILLPVVPFLIWGSSALIGSLIVAFLLVLLIANSQPGNRALTNLRTFAILAISIGLTVLVGLIMK